ncbi:MAG: N-6 DNA methylase, partial [bacterium]|nr:N-6 DNA methylase [bacterium]
TMHMLSWLSTEGTAAIVEFPGVLYRGGAEQKIRKYLIDNNYVDTVIQLPANLFFGVTIATCIIVLKKSKRENKTLFIDASNLFVHEGNKNKLSPENIEAIVAEYADRKEVKHFSAHVHNAQIAENGYNLSVSSYVEAEDTRPEIDIRELNERIRRIVAHENELRAEIDKIIEELEAETL